MNAFPVFLPYLPDLNITRLFIVVLSVACVAQSYFSSLSHKRHDFREKVVEQGVCFGFLYNLSEMFLILRTQERYHKCT